MNQTPTTLKPDFELVTTDAEQSISLSKEYPDTSARWHYHQIHELHFSESRGKFFIGDFIGDYEPGQLVLVGPNIPHNWISDASQNEGVASSDLVLHFSHEFMEQSSQIFPELKHAEYLWSESCRGVEFYGDELKKKIAVLMHGIEETDGFGYLVKFLSIIELLVSCRDRKLLCSKFYEPPVNFKTTKKLNFTVKYIMNNYKRYISLEEAAEVAKMSPGNFSKYFKKISGKCYVDFVSSLRVDKACNLLTNTNSPITEICFLVGFGNISNFNRHFFRLKGMTPSQYRKQFKTCFREGLRDA